MSTPRAFSRDPRGNIRWQSQPVRVTLPPGMDEAEAREIVEIVEVALAAEAQFDADVARKELEFRGRIAQALYAELVSVGFSPKSVAGVVGQWAAQIRRGRAADRTQQLELTNAKGNLVRVLPAEEPLRWLAHELKHGRNPIHM
jgi:predicted membrane chloride channel (bestrophin family)